MPVLRKQQTVPIGTAPVSVYRRSGSARTAAVRIGAALVLTEIISVPRGLERFRYEPLRPSIETALVSTQTVPMSVETLPVSTETVPLSIETASVSIESARVSIESGPVSSDFDGDRAQKIITIDDRRSITALQPLR